MMSPEPMGEMDTAAVTTHEMFTAYVRAGFTEDQALALTIAMVTNSMRSGGGA